MGLKIFVWLVRLLEEKRDLKTYRAIDLNLEIKIISEAGAIISDATRNKYPNVEWREVKAMRISLPMNIKE